MPNQQFIRNWKAQCPPALLNCGIIHKSYNTINEAPYDGLTENDDEYGIWNLPPREGATGEVIEEGKLMVWTDGACKDQSDPEIRRAGCGVWIAPDHPWNINALLPGFSQTSDRAELRALLAITEGAATT